MNAWSCDPLGVDLSVLNPTVAVGWRRIRAALREGIFALYGFGILGALPDKLPGQTSEGVDQDDLTVLPLTDGKRTALAAVLVLDSRLKRMAGDGFDQLALKAERAVICA